MHRINKIVNIQALRGIAVLLVILYHLIKIEGKYGHGNTVLPVFLSIGMSGVDLFFVISGFVMVTITRGWFQNTGAIRRFLYHRLTRIYPAYWFYSLLVLVVFLIKPEMVNSSQGGQMNIFASFLLLPQELLPLLAVGWTLIHEMYFYLMFALLLLFPERWLLSLLMIWGVGAIGVGVALPLTGNPFVQVITHPLTLEFIAGCVIARIYFLKQYSSSGWYFLVLALIWWLVGYGIHAVQGYGLEPTGWLRVLLFGIPAALVVYALVNIERATEQKLPYWLVLIGNASFSIYLSHVLVISALGRIWGGLAIVSYGGNIAALLVILLSVLAIGILSYQILERSLLRFTQRFEEVVVSSNSGQLANYANSRTP
ncbi:MAG: acyltransferase [Methylococcaceae bacterium]